MQTLAVGLLLVSAIFQGRQLKVKDFSNTFIQRVHLLSSTFSMWSRCLSKDILQWQKMDLD